MIGKMEAIATNPNYVGICNGKTYSRMSEYAPRELLIELYLIFDSATNHKHIIVEPDERVRQNTGRFPLKAEFIFSMWVETNKSTELIDSNRWFYDKIELFEKNAQTKNETINNRS